MKKRHLLIALSSLLIVGGTLVGCDQTQEVLSYSVTHNSSTDFKVVGLKASGYVPGEKVTFGVVPNEGKVVESISYGSLQITKESEEVYTFSMPTEAVNLNIVVADYTDEYTALEAAIEVAKTGFATETVFTERQIYIDNAGEISAVYLYGRKITNQLIDGYDLVTRYGSVYNWDVEGDGVGLEIDASETEPEVMYLYARNPEENVFATSYLGIDNKLHYDNILDAGTDEKIRWVEAYANPFDILKASDFTVDSENPNKYVLDNSNPLLEPVMKNLARIIYGEYSSYYVVEEISFTVTNGVFDQIEGKFEYAKLAWNDADVTFKGSFTDFGSDVLEEPTPVDGEEDQEFNAAMAELKEGNYTVVETEHGTDWYDNPVTESARGYSDGGETVVQEFFEENADLTTASPQEAYHYKQITEYDSSLEMNLYSLQQAVKIRDEYYVFGSERDNVNIKDDMLPQFNISSVLFTKEGTKYSYRKDLPYYFYVDSTREMALFTDTSVGALEIEITDVGVNFTNVGSYSTYTFEYTDIGTTTTGTPVVNATTEKLTKWEDYLKTDAQEAEVLAAMPSEILNIVPTPVVSDGGNVCNVTYYISSYYGTVTLYAYLDTAGDYVDLQQDDLLVQCSAALASQGFTQNVENVYDYEFNKEMVVDGKNSIVTISLGLTTDSFAIEYGVEEIVADTTL